MLLRGSAGAALVSAAPAVDPGGDEEKKVRVEILRNTKAGGKTVQMGDVVELEKHEATYLINIRKAVATNKPLREVETPLRKRLAADRARAEAEVKAKADAEAKAKSDAEAKAKAEAEANTKGKK